MSSLVITVKSEEVQADLQAKYKIETGKPQEEALRLSELFRNFASKNRSASFDVQTGSASPVAASATFTLVSAIATDSITIGPVVMVATSTPTLSTDWEIDGASDTLDAASLAAAINAHPTLSQIVTASSATNVVTVAAKQKGVVGNYIACSSQDATITASAAYLSGGTGGVTEVAVNYSCGI